MVTVTSTPLQVNVEILTCTIMTCVAPLALWASEASRTASSISGSGTGLVHGFLVQCCQQGCGSVVNFQISFKL